MKPLRVGLTGGIATGKSYVLLRFRARGVPTIDADEVAREVVAPGTLAADKIRQRFGDDMLDAEGAVDRARLARVVFADAGARRDLEAIVHPPVYRQIERWFAKLAAIGREPIGVADVPLLLETGHESDFDQIVVVAASVEQQLARLKSRDGFDDAQARQRIETQWPIDLKIEKADFVIRTDGTFEDTDRQVDEVLDRLKSIPIDPPV